MDCLDSCLAVTTRNPTPYTPWIAWIPTWIAGNNSKRQTTTSEGPSLQSKRVGMQRVAGPAVISSAFQLPAVISSAFQLPAVIPTADDELECSYPVSYLVCIPTRAGLQLSRLHSNSLLSRPHSNCIPTNSHLVCIPTRLVAISALCIHHL